MTKVRLKETQYGREVYLVYNFTTDEANAFLVKQGEKREWDEATFGMWFCPDSSPLSHYVMIRKRGVDAWTLGALAHEVLHLTFAVLKQAGINHSDSSEEAYTYYMQTIYEQCVDIFKKRRK